MKICVIGTRGFPDYIGGIESVCKNLYTQIVDLDDKLEIVVITRFNTSQHNAARLHPSVIVKTLPTIHIPGVENALHSFISILYSLLVVKPNIIHLHGIGPAFFCRLGKLLGTTVVVTHHAPDYERPKWGKFGKWFLKTGESQAIKHAQKLICVSKYLEHLLLNKYAINNNKLTTIRNGGSLLHAQHKTAAALENESGYFLFVGRLEETKSIHTLITAFKLANTTKKLLIVGNAIGNDPYKDTLIALANTNVVFTGPKFGDELANIYENADAIIQPSTMEGYCLVVAEAISFKKPIILSNIPPHTEFHLPSACFFECGDVGTLATKMSEPNLAKYISEVAISYQQQNTWTRNAEKHLTLYRSLVP